MALLSNQPPKINVGASGPASWLNPGYSYGRNETGYFQKYSEEGTTAEVQDNAYNLDLAGWNYTLTLGKGGTAKLEGSAGWPYPHLYSSETPENIWELDPGDTQKALLEADFPNGSINLSSKKTREALSKINDDTGALWTAATGSVAAKVTMTNGLVYKFDDGAGGDDTQTYIALPADDYDSAYSIYLLMKAGVSAFPEEASIIRHTQLTSNQYTVSASYSNVNKIITSASMESVEGADDLFLFDVPTSPTSSQFIETAGDLAYGWKKVRPNVTRLSRIKWRISQNYQFGLWAVKLYGMPI